MGNVTAKLHGPTYGISMIELYIQRKHRLPLVYFVLQVREITFVLKIYLLQFYIDKIIIDEANFESVSNFRVEAL